jgi:hypothetical protein
MPAKTHGLSGRIPEYSIWRDIRSRCRNKRNKDYARYGKIGIKVCRRWDKFENFLKDVGRRPSKRHQLDRVDNDGDYCKSNCRWATPKENGLNRSTNRMVRLPGMSVDVPMKTAAKKAGIPYEAFRQRLNRWGDLQRALKTPTRKYKRS